MKRLLLILFLALAFPLHPTKSEATVAVNSARDVYAGNGATQIFTYTFRILDKTHIAVYIAGVLKTVDTDYTVGNIGSATGSITFTVAPADKAQVLFMRNVPFNQLSDYIQGEAFPAERIERDYDKLWMAIQQINERLGRIHQVSPTSNPITLPDQCSGSDKMTGFDANGLISCAADQSGGAGSAAWSSITDPTGNQTLAMGANTTTHTWGAATGATPMKRMTDTLNNTGTGAILQVDTASGSAADPLKVCAKGTSNCLVFDQDANFGTTGTATSTFAVSNSQVVTALGAITPWGSIGQVSKNNAGTPNTQFDLNADVVVLRNPSSPYGTVLRYKPGAITNNISTAGPAANGRDQAGAFPANSWIRLYWIWNGTTLATLSSVCLPTDTGGGCATDGGPNLPATYTHWSFAGTVRLNASTQIVSTQFRGNKAFYHVGQNVLAAGTATTETAISLSSVLPPEALEVQTNITLLHGANTSVAGTIDGEMRYVSGSIYVGLEIRAAGAGVQVSNTSTVVFPNVSQQIFYRLSGSDGNPVLVVNVIGYTMPNGG